MPCSCCGKQNVSVATCGRVDDHPCKEMYHPTHSRFFYHCLAFAFYLIFFCDVAWLQIDSLDDVMNFRYHRPTSPSKNVELDYFKEQISDAMRRDRKLEIQLSWLPLSNRQEAGPRLRNPITTTEELAIALPHITQEFALRAVFIKAPWRLTTFFSKMKLCCP